jgi:fluoroacetyl-CoA thioesterase
MQPGAAAAVEETVTEAMTATALGSGDVPVLGTPKVLAMVEAAAVAAVASELADGHTTVGVSVELQHLAPTPVGARVTARAELVEAAGRRLRFAFEVTDATGVVATGTHTRVVVERGPFLEAARERG